VVRYRNDLDQARAEERRRALVESLDDPGAEEHYAIASPSPANRYSFRPQAITSDYASWPRLIDLCGIAPLNGMMEKRGGALVDIQAGALRDRLERYFDSSLDWEAFRLMQLGLHENAARFDARMARQKALTVEIFNEERMVRYFIRPFDVRWAYYTSIRPVWNEHRPELWRLYSSGTPFLITRPGSTASPDGVPASFTRALGDNDALRGHAYYIPLRRASSEEAGDLFGDGGSYANLSLGGRAWLDAIGWSDSDAEQDAGAAPWYHALAICHAPAWVAENSDGVLADWPRVPLPSSAEALRASAALGARLAALLDPDEQIPGVTSGILESPLGAFGTITRAGGGSLGPAELAVTAGWGHGGGGRPVMPNRGRLTERDAYAADELAQIESAAAGRGDTIADLLAHLGPPVNVWLNDIAHWCTVPRAVWDFRIGGYQVVKKWLSYREFDVLGRPLTTAEVREVTAMVRRLAAIVLMQPELDANYQAIRDNAFPWPRPS
jgi:hypothetical protein